MTDRAFGLDSLRTRLPVEIGTCGNDLLELRARFGRELRYMGDSVGGTGSTPAATD